MAYNFDRLNQMLEDSNQGKINIFGQTQQGVGNDAVAANNTDSIQKGGSGGVDVSAGGASGMQAGGEKASVSSTDAPQQAALFDRNVGAQRAPKSILKIGENLNSKQADLQAEADSYMQGAKGVKTGIGEDVIGNAVGGDAGAMATVRDRVRTPGQEYQAFNPLTDVNAEDRNIEDIKTETGLQHLLRKEAGPRYNKAESAFDTALLMANPEFAKVRASLIDAQGGLKSNAKELAASKTKEAQGIVSGEYDTSTNALKDALSKAGKGIISSNRVDADEYNKSKAALDLAKLAKEKGAGVVNEAKGLTAGFQPYTTEGRAVQYIPGVLPGVDASPFISTTAEPGWKSFVDPGESSKFARILGLLGASDIDGEGPLQAGTPQTAMTNFDNAGFSKAVVDAALKKSAAVDDPKRQQIASLIGASQVKADDANKQFAGIKNTPEAIAERRMAAVNALKGIAPQGYNQDLFNNLLNNVGNFDDYYDFKDADPTQFISSDDLGKMNLLSGELEQGNPYKAYAAPEGTQQLNPETFLNTNRLLRDWGDKASHLSTEKGLLPDSGLEDRTNTVDITKLEKDRPGLDSPGMIEAAAYGGDDNVEYNTNTGDYIKDAANYEKRISKLQSLLNDQRYNEKEKAAIQAKIQEEQTGLEAKKNYRPTVAPPAQNTLAVGQQPGPINQPDLSKMNPGMPPPSKFDFDNIYEALGIR